VLGTGSHRFHIGARGIRGVTRFLGCHSVKQIGRTQNLLFPSSARGAQQDKDTAKNGGC